MKVFSSYQTLVFSFLSFDKLGSGEKKLNFSAVYITLLISIVSLPINLTVCSMILPDPTLFWAPNLIISWFHHVPMIKSSGALPLYEDPSIKNLFSFL